MPTEMPRARRLSVPSHLKGPEGVEAQPVSSVRWVMRDQLQANDYNPNHVAPPELRLLRISILADGWTQPIVVRETGPEQYEVVDGFHRWMVSEDKRIAAMTGGLVPIAVVPEKPQEHRMMSTVRHNRARGEHRVDGMARIVVRLLESGMGEDEIGDLMQMDTEEVRRLREFGNMRKRGSADEFAKGWTPQ